MGLRFRKRIAAGQNNKSIKDITSDVRKLKAAQTDMVDKFNYIVAALVEATGCEEKLRQVLNLPVDDGDVNTVNDSKPIEVETTETTEKTEETMEVETNG